MTSGNSESKLTLVVQLACVLLLGMLPFVLAFLYYYAVPGFIIPFLNHPICRLLLYALLLWEFAGLFLLFKTSDLKGWLLLAIVFVLPAVIWLSVGPYCLTIFQVVSPFTGLEPTPARTQLLGETVLKVWGWLDKIHLERLHLTVALVMLVGIAGSYPGLWMRLVSSIKQTAPA